MTTLREGLQASDLDYTIMPLISIDEYESKIDDRKAIVVGFYVTEQDPATDLAAFIEKGVVKVLDTDVSPAPTEDGHYLVFVEMDRDDTFPKKLLTIIKEVGNLTNVDEWEFSPLHSKQDENYDLTVEELEKHVNLDPESIEIDDEEDDSDDDLAETVADFLRSSLVESCSMSGKHLTMSTHVGQRHYEIVKIADHAPEMPVLINKIGDPRLMESSRLQNLLGQSYAVYVSGDHLLVTNDDGYLLLKTID